MRFALLIGCAATLIACGQAPDPEPAHPVADLVLTNGNVVTVDDRIPRQRRLQPSVIESLR